MFTLKGTDLHEVLTLLHKVLGKDPPVVGIKAKNNKLEIRAASNGAMFYYQMPCSTPQQSECRFSLPTSRLASVCARRGEITFNLQEETKLLYKLINGAYKGELICYSYSKVEIELPDSDKKIANEKTINEYIKYVNIKSLTDANMYLQIQCKEMLSMAVADNYYIALLHTKSPGKNLPDIIIPLKYQMLFSSWFKSDYSLYKTDSFFIAKTTSCLVFLPVIDVDLNSLQDINKYINNSLLAPSVTFEIDTERLKHTMANIESIYDKTVLNLTCNKSNLIVKMESSFGRSSDAIDVKVMRATSSGGGNSADGASSRIDVNYAMLKDCVDKIEEAKLTMNFIDNKSVILQVSGKNYDLTYVVTAVVE